MKRNNYSLESEKIESFERRCFSIHFRSSHDWHVNEPQRLTNIARHILGRFFPFFKENIPQYNFHISRVEFATISAQRPSYSYTIFDYSFSFVGSWVWFILFASGVLKLIVVETCNKMLSKAVPSLFGKKGRCNDMFMYIRMFCHVLVRARARRKVFRTLH